MKPSARVWLILGLILSAVKFTVLSVMLYYIRPAGLFSQRVVWALIGLGFSLLLMSVLAVELLRRKPAEPQSFPPVWRIFLMIYVLTPVVLVFPVWIVAIGLGIFQTLPTFFSPQQILALPAPWVWIIQGSLLFLFMLPQILPVRQWFSPISQPLLTLGASFLLGWMLALMSLFGYHLSARLLGVNPGVIPAPENIQKWVAGFLGVLILPISEQLFFRKYLFQALTLRLSPIQAGGASALLFALVQGRPLLFLPALIFSLLLQWLTRSFSDPRVALLTHAFANVFLMILNWNLIL